MLLRVIGMGDSSSTLLLYSLGGGSHIFLRTWIKLNPWHQHRKEFLYQTKVKFVKYTSVQILSTRVKRNSAQEEGIPWRFKCGLLRESYFVVFTVVIFTLCVGFEAITLFCCHFETGSYTL